MPHRTTWMTAILFAAVMVSLPVRAQVGIDDTNLAEQRFTPSPHVDDFISVMGSHVRDTWDWRLGLFLNWSGETLAFTDAAGNKDQIVEGKLTGDIIASMSFFEYLSLGIVLPLNIYTMSGDPASPFNGTAGAIDRGGVEDFTLGDLRISPKVKILDAEDYGVGLAVAVDLIAPTGTKDAFATDDAFSVMPRLILDMDIESWRLALNVGYRWRGDSFNLRWLDIGEHQLYLGFAVDVPLIRDSLELIGEIETATDLENFFADSHNDFLEGRLALRYRAPFGLGVTVGGGAGFLDSWGSPLYRVFAAIDYMPPIVRDLDGDGIVDDEDRCPSEPEDFDSFQDSDGCPEADNDKDGVLDVDDACPGEPEDMDGFEDADGCPEWDNDKDGFKDGEDQCPNEAEDVDGCLDEDGCPEPGNVCVTETEIKILQMVYFETGKARILPESFPILDEVAQVLQDHPEITKVEIQGHTDDRGSDKSNLRLSAARAKSVMTYLTKAGIDRTRLTSKGYGETTPIDTNETDEGRARNRRVEFHIMEKAQP